MCAFGLLMVFVIVAVVVVVVRAVSMFCEVTQMPTSFHLQQDQALARLISARPAAPE